MIEPLIASPFQFFYVVLGVFNPLAWLMAFAALLQFEPFSTFFWSTHLAVFPVVMLIAERRRADFVTFLPTRIFCFALLALWLSLDLSVLPFHYPSEPDPFIAPASTGGFPIAAFIYPFHPMGSDSIPVEMWLGFYLNEIFWVTFSCFIVALVPRLRKLQPSFLRLLPLVAFLVSFSATGNLIFAFD
jgi:hypothetical protein